MKSKKMPAGIKMVPSVGKKTISFLSKVVDKLGQAQLVDDHAQPASAHA